MGDAADDAIDRMLDHATDFRQVLRLLMPGAFDYAGREHVIAEGLRTLNRDTWTTKAGEVLHPSEMSDSHRRNARAMIVRKLTTTLAAQGIRADAAKVVSLTTIGRLFDELSPEEPA